MVNLNWAVIPMMMSSVIAFAGSMEDVNMHDMSIHPGFIAGIEGGVANVDWPRAGGNSFSSNINYSSYVLSKQNNVQNAYAGIGGGFVGYKFPVHHSFAFEPQVAYHYISSSSLNITNYYTNITGLSVSITPESISLKSQQMNIVDLTIQGNYRIDHGDNLYSGINFFLQPGVAIVMNQYQYSDSYVSGLSMSETNVRLCPEITIGLGKMLTDHVNLFAKYNYLIGNDLNSITATITPNVSMIMGGLSFEA